MREDEVSQLQALIKAEEEEPLPSQKEAAILDANTSAITLKMLYSNFELCDCHTLAANGSATTLYCTSARMLRLFLEITSVS